MSMSRKPTRATECFRLEFRRGRWTPYWSCTQSINRAAGAPSRPTLRKLRANPQSTSRNLRATMSRIFDRARFFAKVTEITAKGTSPQSGSENSRGSELPEFTVRNRSVQLLDLATEARNTPTRFLEGCAGRNVKFVIPHLADDVRLFVIPTEFPRRSPVQKAHLSAGIVEKTGPLHIYYLFGRIRGPRRGGGNNGSRRRRRR